MKKSVFIFCFLLLMNGCSQSDNQVKLNSYRNDIERLLSLKNRFTELKREENILLSYNYKNNIGTVFLKGNDKFINAYYESYSAEGSFKMKDNDPIYVKVDESGNLTSSNVDKEGNFSSTNDMYKSLKDFPGISVIEETEDKINTFYNYIETVELKDYSPLCHTDDNINVCKLGNDSIEFEIEEDSLLSTTYTDKINDLTFYVRITYNDISDKNVRKWWFGY